MDYRINNIFNLTKFIQLILNYTTYSIFSKKKRLMTFNHFFYLPKKTKKPLLRGFIFILRNVYLNVKLVLETNSDLSKTFTKNVPS